MKQFVVELEDVQAELMSFDVGDIQEWLQNAANVKFLSVKDAFLPVFMATAMEKGWTIPNTIEDIVAVAVENGLLVEPTSPQPRPEPVE